MIIRTLAFKPVPLLPESAGAESTGSLRPPSGTPREEGERAVRRGVRYRHGPHGGDGGAHENTNGAAKIRPVKDRARHPPSPPPTPNHHHPSIAATASLTPPRKRPPRHPGGVARRCRSLLLRRGGPTGCQGGWAAAPAASKPLEYGAPRRHGLPGESRLFHGGP